MKFCGECGTTGSVWVSTSEGEFCPMCGSKDLHTLADELVDVEFQSIVETAFSPFDRHFLQAQALTIEENRE